MLGVRRTVTGSTGLSLCLIFCHLDSLLIVPPLNEFIAGNGITCRISCYQYVVIGTWIWPLSKMFLCRGTLQSSVGSLQCWCCFSMSFVGISTMSFCQRLLCVFGFIYMPTKHWIQAQTSFCKVRARNSTVSSLGVLQVQQNPLKSPSACLNKDLADQSWNALQLDVLMPCFFFFFFAGGLLICLPREQAARFCAEIKSPKYGEGHQAWIIGIVEKGNRTARIIDKPRIIEVAPQVATQNVNPTPGATS